MAKVPRILYFVNGVLPSKEAQKEAQKYGSNVGFRNVKMLNDRDAIEECDGVAGEVPNRYKHFPKAEKVIADFENQTEAKTEDLQKAKKEQRNIVEQQRSENGDADDDEVMRAIAFLKPNQYTQGGLPSVEALETITNKDVSSEQRDRVYQVYKQKQTSEWKPNA